MVKNNLNSFSKLNQRLNIFEDEFIKTNKRTNKKIVLLIILSITLSMLFVTIPIFTSKIFENMELSPGPYLLEPLRGDTIDTWMSWQLEKDDLFHVHIVETNFIPEHMIKSIENSILSETTIKVDDLILHKGPQGENSIFYKGWANALQSIDDKSTLYHIPDKFHVHKTNVESGNAVIKFEKAKNADGYSGFTKSILDEDQNQILKSVITIYESNTITDKELEILIRHEFGHVLGLIHSTDSDDLMAPRITTEYPYISECDLDAIQSLYDGQPLDKITCKK